MRRRALTAPLSRTSFALLISLFLVGACNARFWTERTGISATHGVGDWLFLGSLLLILVASHTAVLLLLPGTRLLKTAGILACLAGAAGAYFSGTYGVLFDRDMMRNVLETDVREAMALANLRFAGYVALLGILPALPILKARVQSLSIARQALHAVRFIAGTAVLIVTVVALLGASSRRSCASTRACATSSRRRTSSTAA